MSNVQYVPSIWFPRNLSDREGRQFSLFPRTRFRGSMNVEMVWQQGRARRFQYQVENGRVINSVDTNRFRSVHYTRWIAKTHRGFRAAALRRGISYCTGNSCTFSNCGRRFNRPNLVTYEWCSCRLLLVPTNESLRRTRASNSMHTTVLHLWWAALSRAVLNT